LLIFFLKKNNSKNFIQITHYLLLQSNFLINFRGLTKALDSISFKTNLSKKDIEKALEDVKKI
jgi:hypothetical protein